MEFSTDDANWIDLGFEKETNLFNNLIVYWLATPVAVPVTNVIYNKQYSVHLGELHQIQALGRLMNESTMIIQFCGLSGSGKTTLANQVKLLLDKRGINTEVIDGDVYRKVLCHDLGFSKADRNENIRRLAFVAALLSKYKVVSIICAINPYQHIREEIAGKYPDVKTVY